MAFRSCSEPSIPANSGTNPLLTLVDAVTTIVDEATERKSRVSSPPTTTVIPIVPSSPTSSTSSKSEGSSSSSSSPTSHLFPLTSCQSMRKDPHKKSFADMLMEMLMDEQYARVVTFLPDRQSWGIINAKKFSDEVMPKVFNIRTFSSFVRKLHRWGFERIMERKTHDVDIFRHLLFRKGDYKSCAKIRCVGRLNKSSPAPSKPISKLAAAITPSPCASMKHTKRNLPCPIYNQALHDVTSQVVSAALETLRRDEVVGIASPPLTTNTSARLKVMARKQVEAEMMALQKQAQATKPLRYVMTLPRLPRMGFY